MRVFITGAGGGLGRAFATECAQRGFDLFLTDIDDARLTSIRAGIQRQYDVDVVLHSCDLTSRQEVAQMMQMLDERGLRFDMLLNVAGVDFEGGFMERGVEKILNIVQINIEATLRITHDVLKRRAPSGKFHIIFVSSLASMYPMPLKATYAASKRFLLDFATALGQELEDENVSVLSLCPGGLATTNEAQCGIAAQGFWGFVTANRLERIAEQTLDKAFQGKKIYVPGALNRTFSVVSALVPRSWLARMLHGRWKTAQAKWLTDGAGGIS